MEQELSLIEARALLEWQVELGATEAIGDAPLDRYEAPQTIEKPAQGAPANAGGRSERDHPQAVAAPPPLAAEDPGRMLEAAVSEARAAAAGAATLDDLRAAMGAFSHCDLRLGARNLVFGDGNPASPVMIIGEAPGRDEDMQGKPFVGAAGQLLDRMLAAIDLDRASSDAASSVYITNILPWRPPQNRDPSPAEIAMLMPFVERHVQLAAPKILVCMGNISCLALLGRKGISRLRGSWAQAMDLPVMPMFHPAYLLRNPVMKREAWADLLELRARLDKG